MQHATAVRRAFTDPEEFWSSPLYRALCAVVAADPYLVGVAAHTRDGQVRRAVALRLALAEIATTVGDAPVHLLEVGSSAGLLLRHAHYGYRLGDRTAGDPASPVQLVTRWRGAGRPPDLDVVPRIVSTTGLDVHPLDPAVEADRCWLEALVWPEDRDEAALLHEALALAARVPAPVFAADAVDGCPRWSRAVPAGEVRVVFHSATRMHVPTSRLPAFDAAVDGVGDDGPLYRVALEGDALEITPPGGAASPRYAVDGHLAWAAPVADGDPLTGADRG